MPKDWLSYEQQVDLLADRGMVIANTEDAAQFLSQVNYYRFSGYFRHWQYDPARGHNRFFEGTTFEKKRFVAYTKPNKS